MKHLVICCVALLAAVVAAQEVLVLDDSNFSTEVAKHSLLLIEFYAPWCGHCKKLAPEYDAAAVTLSKEDPPLYLAKVDCTTNQDTCGKFGVSGYPTLKIFRGGEFSQEYSGPRSADGIVSFIKKQAGPSSKVLETVEQWEKFLKNENAVLVGYFSAESSDISLFQKAADSLREDYKFGHTTSEEVMAAAKAKDTVILHRPKRLSSIFEEQQVTLDKTPNTANVRSFLEDNYVGRCYHLTTGNLKKFRRPLVIALVDKLDYVKDPKGSNYWRNRVMKFSKEYSDKLNFAVAKTGEMTQLVPESLMSEQDDSDKKTQKIPPKIVILDAKDKRYIMSDVFDADNFKAFLTDYLDGKVSPYIKSEKAPEDNSGPVTVLVGQNFDEIVNDDSKSALVEFYAPWCGHCKSLEPKWNELGEKMKDVDDIIIAKMDATANDAPSDYEVRGFPTIYYKPKGGAPQKYEGGREVKDFVKYLKEKSPDSFKKKTEL